MNVFFIISIIFTMRILRKENVPWASLQRRIVVFLHQSVCRQILFSVLLDLLSRVLCLLLHLKLIAVYLIKFLYLSLIHGRLLGLLPHDLLLLLAHRCPHLILSNHLGERGSWLLNGLILCQPTSAVFFEARMRSRESLLCLGELILRDLSRESATTMHPPALP